MQTKLKTMEDFSTPPKKRLRINGRAKAGSMFRLPFYKRGGRGSWGVPATGYYTGGCKTGDALAMLYMKHIKDHQTAHLGGTLQHIAMSMLDFDGLVDDVEKTSRRGQAVGFFTTIERVLCMGLKHLNFDKCDEKELLKQANLGLGHDEPAYMEYLTEIDEARERVENVLYELNHEQLNYAHEIVAELLEKHQSSSTEKSEEQAA